MGKRWKKDGKKMEIRRKKDEKRGRPNITWTEGIVKTMRERERGGITGGRLGG